MADNENIFTALEPEGQTSEYRNVFGELDPKPRVSPQRAREVATVAAAASYGLDGFDTAYKNMQEAVQMGEENAIRQSASMQYLGRRLDELKEQFASEEPNYEIAARSMEYVTQVRQEADRNAMEKEAVDKLLEYAERNPSWSELALIHKPVLQKVAEDVRKDLIIRDAIAKATELSANETGVGEFFDDAAEIGLSFVTLGFDDLLSSLRSKDWDMSAKHLQGIADGIRELPEEEIPFAVEQVANSLLRSSSFFVEDNEEAISLLNAAFGSKADYTSDLATTQLLGIFAPFEVLGAGPTVSAVKNLFTRTGNKMKVAEDAAKVLTDTTADSPLYDDAASAVEDMIPMSANRKDYQLSAAIKTKLDENQAHLDLVKNLNSTERLSPEELAVAIRKQTNKFKKIYGKSEITGSSVVFDSTTGTHNLTLNIGKRDGTGFLKESTAKAFIKKNRINGATIEQDPDTGSFFVKVTHPVTEAMADSGFQDVKTNNLAKRIFQSARSYVDNFLGTIGTRSGYSEGKIYGQIKDIYNRNIGVLNAQKFKEVSSILDAGLREERWYSPNELQVKAYGMFNKALDEDQVTAYYASKQIEDFAHYIDNKAIYQEKATKGMLTVNMKFTKQGPMNAQVYTDPNDFDKALAGQRVYNAASNTFQRADPTLIQKLKDEGYIVIRPEDASWTVGELGEGASVIVTKQAKLVDVSPLSMNQLNYVAGGRRIYSNSNFFLGQLRKGKFADGTEYAMTPSVLRTAKTSKSAEEWAAKMNAANQVLKNFRDNKIPADEASDLIERFTGMSMTDYANMVDDEGWDISEKILVRRDRGEFPTDFEGQHAMRLYNPETLDDAWGVVKRGNRHSGRGERILRDVDGEEAEISSFYEAMSESVSKAIKFGAYSDFRISAINRFNTQFGAYIENFGDLTPFEIATKGEVSKKLLTDGKAGLYHAIKAHQFYIRSVLRTRTEWDHAVQRTMDRLAKVVEGKSEALASSLYRANNPIEKLRGLNFDFNLGMFNPAQLFLQANSMANAVTLSPKFGLAAFKDVPILRYALIANDDEVTEYLLKQSKDVIDTNDISEFKRMINQIKRIGMNNFGTNLAVIDAQSSLAMGANPLLNKVSKVRENGRFFFEEGERMGRLTAYGIARRKFKDQFPSKDPFSRKADEWILEEADRILLSPNSDNNQLFTKGITSIPTQFWSYMFKMSEAILTGSGGRYTLGERMRMLGGQVLFYGAAGAPFLDYAVERLETSTGEVRDPFLNKAIHNGFIDTAIYALSNGTADTDFSGRSGLGGFWLQMIQNITENPVSTLALGATGGNISGGLKAFTETARFYNMWENPSAEAVTMASLAGMSRMVKSMDVVTQGILAYNTGIWYDRHGRALGGVSKEEAIASVLGFSPQLISDYYKMSAQDKDAKNKYINEVSSTLQALHNKWLRAETPEEQAHIEQIVNTLAVTSQQTGHWPEVAGRFQAFLRDPTMLDSLQRRYAEKYFEGKQGYNYNYLTEDLKRQILEAQEKGND